MAPVWYTIITVDNTWKKIGVKRLRRCAFVCVVF